MDRINELASEKGILVVEDCAQAHFARFNKDNVGTIGDIRTFSFYPGKNLGAYGDGGMITTQNPKFYTKLHILRNLGSIRKNSHEYEGLNSRLDTIQYS